MAVEAMRASEEGEDRAYLGIPTYGVLSITWICLLLLPLSHYYCSFYTNFGFGMRIMHLSAMYATDMELAADVEIWAGYEGRL